jgi:hypothetical protein
MTRIVSFVTWLDIRDEFLTEKKNDTPIQQFGKVLMAESLVAVIQVNPDVWIKLVPTNGHDWVMRGCVKCQ